MVQLSDVLKAIGPNATIVFAAWIFMGFLQQRYDAALGRASRRSGTTDPRDTMPAGPTTCGPRYSRTGAAAD